MTPRDVRERFEEGARGSWQTHLGGGSPGTSDDTVLTWSALSTGLATSGNDHGPNRAVFEFHLGMLVAMRAHLRERPAGVGTDEYVEVTSKTVTSRRPGASETGGTDVTVLALDCPTHRQEAQRMASKAVK